MFENYILLMGKRQDRKQVVMDLTNYCWATTDCGYVEIGIERLTEGESLSEIDLARNLCENDESLDINEECRRISTELELARMADTAIGRSTIHFYCDDLVIEFLSQFTTVAMECQILDISRNLLLYLTIKDGRCSTIEEIRPAEGRIDPHNDGHFFNSMTGCAFEKQPEDGEQLLDPPDWIAVEEKSKHREVLRIIAEETGGRLGL